MHREYDLFRRSHEKSAHWLYSIIGLKEACERLEKEAEQTPAEVYLQHLRSGEIVARLNIAMSDRGKAFFYVGRDPAASANVTSSLSRLGYTVTTHQNNETARVVLGLMQSYDYFILGDGAAGQREAICWFIKNRFPRSVVLALNRHHSELAGADLNFPEISVPGKWIAAMQDLLKPGSFPFLSPAANF